MKDTESLQGLKYSVLGTRICVPNLSRDPHFSFP